MLRNIAVNGNRTRRIGSTPAHDLLAKDVALEFYLWNQCVTNGSEAVIQLQNAWTAGCGQNRSFVARQSRSIGACISENQYTVCAAKYYSELTPALNWRTKAPIVLWVITMDDRTSSILVIALGLLLLFVVLTADITGVGAHIGFGSRQVMGTVFGIVVLAIGIDLFRDSSKGGKSAE